MVEEEIAVIEEKRLFLSFLDLLFLK